MESVLFFYRVLVITYGVSMITLLLGASNGIEGQYDHSFAGCE
jgi:hypothetical protein